MAVRTVVVGIGAAALLAGCGGGVYLSFQIGDGGDDGGPSVSLVASTTTASRGGIVRLSATARDDDGVDYVAFYRDDGNWTLLARDPTSPYVYSAPIPSDAGSTVRFLARAVDFTGDAGESSVVTIDVVP